jgi:hypothetical protein
VGIGCVGVEFRGLEGRDTARVPGMKKIVTPTELYEISSKKVLGKGAWVS